MGVSVVGPRACLVARSSGDTSRASFQRCHRVEPTAKGSNLWVVWCFCSAVCRRGGMLGAASPSLSPDICAHVHTHAEETEQVGAASPGGPGTPFTAPRVFTECFCAAPGDHGEPGLPASEGPGGGAAVTWCHRTRGDGNAGPGRRHLTQRTGGSLPGKVSSKLSLGECWTESPA